MAPDGSHTGNKRLGQFVTFVLLLIFWVAFSGKFDAFHFGLGLASCLLIALLSHDLLFHDLSGKNKLRTVGRFFLYIPWLIYQVILASLHVAWLVLNPKGLHPQIVTVKTKLRSDISMVTFANSITLTPGTITMDIQNGTYYVHAISQETADGLLTGDMENRVAKVFFEEDEKNDSR